MAQASAATSSQLGGSAESARRTGAVVVSWGAGIPGREAKLLEVFGRALAYGEELRAAERVDAVHVYRAKAGPPRDALVFAGALDAMTELLVDERFEGLLIEGSMVVQDLDVALWEGGPAAWMAEGIDPYVTKLQEHDLL